MQIADMMDPLAFKLAALTTSAASGAASIATVDLTMGILGVPLSVFLAGFAGALVSLSFLPPPMEGDDLRKTITGMAWHVISGTMLSAFITPSAMLAIRHWITPAAPPEIALGVAGMFGALIMLLLPIGVQYLKKFSGGA